jgi:hypothetical protein
MIREINLIKACYFHVWKWHKEAQCLIQLIYTNKKVKKGYPSGRNVGKKNYHRKNSKIFHGVKRTKDKMLELIHTYKGVMTFCQSKHALSVLCCMVRRWKELLNYTLISFLWRNKFYSPKKPIKITTQELSKTMNFFYYVLTWQPLFFSE